jgi:addiction module HigA family antidote
VLRKKSDRVRGVDMAKRRKSTHPGIILNEDYIKPLELNLRKLADDLSIERKILSEMLMGKANITPC